MSSIVFTLLWTFLTLVIASLIIGWAAEVIAIYFTASIALAILAWLQTAPEFAVEANIAWGQNASLVLANLTGSLRLLMGLGWPMVCFIHYISKRRDKKDENYITLPLSFSIESASLIVPVFYFSYIAFKGHWDAVDGIILCLFYGVYLGLLYRQRKKGLRDVASEEDSLVVRKILNLRPFWQKKVAFGMLLLGGFALFFCVSPFIEALKATAQSMGIGEFIFIQWIAPLASEFPEKITAFNWARHSRKVPMAIVNMLSSMVSQWTLLAGLIPLIFSMSSGKFITIELSNCQRMEIILTVIQSALAALLLLDLKISFLEAAGLFALWLMQFVFPSSRVMVVGIYGIWILIELAWLFAKPSRIVVWRQIQKIIFHPDAL